MAEITYAKESSILYPFGIRKGTGLRAAWLAGAALALGGASGARAQTQTFTFSGDLSGSQVVTLSQGCGSASSQVYAGRYKGQLGSGPATNIFCVDAGHEIAVGDTYAANTQYNITGPAGALNGGYYAGGLASALTDGDIASVTLTQASGRAGEVAYLADTYLNATSFSGASGSTDTGLNLTGLGLSVWDILQDGGGGLTSGQIQTGRVGRRLVWRHGELLRRGGGGPHRLYLPDGGLDTGPAAGRGRTHAGLRLREARHPRRPGGRAGAGHPGLPVQPGPRRGRLLAAPQAADAADIECSSETGQEEAASIRLAASFCAPYVCLFFGSHSYRIKIVELSCLWT